MFQPLTSSFEVKELQQAEQSKLDTARAKVEAANAELVAIEDEIKSSYGQFPPRVGTFVTTTGCIQGSTSVQLKGKYALISKEVHSLCGPINLGK